MTKTPPKTILKRVRERAKAETKANFTFRLRTSLMAAYRVKCKKEDVSMTSVLEALLAEFTYTDKK